MSGHAHGPVKGVEAVEGALKGAARHPSAVEAMIINDARELTHTLKSFAEAPLEKKEKMLPGVIDDIKRLATPEVMLRMVNENGKEFPGFTEKLNEASIAASKTPLKTMDGVKHDWFDHFIVVVLGEDGRLMGYNLIGHIDHQEYIHYALAKAVCGMMLDAKGRETYGDISGLPSDFQYLEGLGLKRGENLFMGFTDHVLLDGKKVFLAGGYCHLRPEYAEELIQGKPKDRNTLAGVAERTIAEIVGKYLAEGVPEKIVPVEEPPLLALWRVAH